MIPNMFYIDSGCRVLVLLPARLAEGVTSLKPMKKTVSGSPIPPAVVACGRKASSNVLKLISVFL